MNTRIQKIFSLILACGILCSTLFHAAPVRAAGIKMNKKTLSLAVGKSYKLKVKKASGKVKWSSSKKSVATVSSKGTVTAKKAGTATITAKAKGKKTTCTVTVKGTQTSGAAGSKTNPISAYSEYTFSYYEEGKKRGKFSMKLLDFATGDESAALVTKNSQNPVPEESQEYLYFQFRIKYISGSQTVSAKDIFDYYHNIFGSNSTRPMTNIDWGFFFENVDDLGTTILSPGNDIICAKAILVDKGYGPITYRIQTGKNSYTWFTTDK